MHSNPTASTRLSTSQRDNDGQRSKESNAKRNTARNQQRGDEIKALLSNIALWRGRGQVLFTLTTGGVGGTTGIIGAAGGGGAAAGGAVTGGTLAVMVGTGVAAMTGVWDTAGGTLWNGAGGETEDTATACCAPFKGQSENTLWCTDGYKCWQDMGSKVTVVLLYRAVRGLAKLVPNSWPQEEHTGHRVRFAWCCYSGSNKNWRIIYLTWVFLPWAWGQPSASKTHHTCTHLPPSALCALVSSLHTESNSTALPHWCAVQMDASQIFIWQTVAVRQTRPETLGEHYLAISHSTAPLDCTVPFPASSSSAKSHSLEHGSDLSNRLVTFTDTRSGKYLHSVSPPMVYDLCL